MMTLTNKYMKPDADIRKDAILALCQRLQAAAIKCDDHHVFVSYAPHVELLSVLVRNKDHDYEADIDNWPIPIFCHDIYLKKDGALESLIKTADQLQRLGVDI